MKNVCISMFNYVLLIGVMLLLLSCKDDKEIIVDNGKIVTEQSMDFPSGGGLKEVKIETDLEFSKLKYAVSSAGDGWCSVSAQDDKLFVEVNSNRDADKERITVLTLYTEKGLRQDIPIKQSKFSYPEEGVFDPLTIFTDLSCSEVKPEITEEDIINIPEAFYKDIAIKLRAGNYEDKEYRIQSYRPYQTPKVSAARTKTLHTWGILDNVTGIYVENPEEEIAVLVGDTHGQEVKLRVQNYTESWGGTTTILKSGLNLIKPGTGLCYILIHQDEYIPLNPDNDAEKEAIDSKRVKIHFAEAKVNGYYDVARNKSEDSPTLLSKAQFPYFDIKGKYCQLVWYTEDFQAANTDFSETIKRLDRLVELEIDFSGFFKYGKAYSTRMQFMPSTSGGGNPNATVERVIFPRDYKNFLANPDDATFMNRTWGLAHEVGHCSQSNPGMRWGGMGEVGNNMFSMYVKTQLFGYENSNMLVEGYYEKARTLIIDGNLAHADLSITGNKHFERLVPFWQIQLYMTEVKGYKDFNRDLYEHYRVTPDVGTTFNDSGLLQLDYIRNVCNLSKTNMLDFFEKWGFLKPIDVVINDYGDRKLKITQEEIDALVAEIEAKNYPEPTKDITMIQDDNFNDFK